MTWKLAVDGAATVTAPGGTRTVQLPAPATAGTHSVTVTASTGGTDTFVASKSFTLATPPTPSNVPTTVVAQKVTFTLPTAPSGVDALVVMLGSNTTTVAVGKTSLTVALPGTARSYPWSVRFRSGRLTSAAATGSLVVPAAPSVPRGVRAVTAPGGVAVLTWASPASGSVTSSRVRSGPSPRQPPG